MKEEREGSIGKEEMKGRRIYSPSTK